jgi:hypothetical protein
MLTRIDRLSRPALNKGIYVCTRARAGAAANLKAARAGALCSAADGDRNAEQDSVVQLCVARLCGRAWSDYRKSCTAAVPARYCRASEGVAALGRLGSSSVFVYVPTRDICTSDCLRFKLSPATNFDSMLFYRSSISCGLRILVCRYGWQLQPAA